MPDQDENLRREAVLRLEKAGGYCDCEVIGNAEEAFEEAVSMHNR
jgi:hypothetical protein